MKKRLERDQEKAVVSGVLAGLANYFDQDPALFRLAAVVFLIVTGFFPGLLFYLVAWVIMPKSVKPKADYEVTN
ncbi:MAG: PspC domain-containing protein [Patescibacteria group bacterium]